MNHEEYIKITSRGKEKNAELLNSIFRERHLKIWNKLSSEFGYPIFHQMINEKNSRVCEFINPEKNSFFKKRKKKLDKEMMVGISWFGVEDQLLPIDDYVKKIKNKIKGEK